MKCKQLKLRNMQWNLQWFFIISEKENPVQQFLLAVISALEDNPSDSLSEVLTPVLDVVYRKFTKGCTLTSTDVPEYLGVLKFFTLKPNLAEVNV